MKTTKPRAKRVLKEISFDHQGAHLALCSASQGSANNRNAALLLKGSNFSQEVIEKMQSIQVTMSIPDFLQKFFYLYEEDAEFLAGLMGYKEPPEDEAAETAQEAQDWISQRFESFEVLKSLNTSSDLNKTLSELTEQEYLSYLLIQEQVEKALELRNKESEAAVSAESDNSTYASVEKTVEASASNKEGNLMTQEVKTVEQEVTVEMVEKSAFEVVQKALDEQKVLLEKAMQTIAAFEQEKKEQIVKSKTAKVSAVIKSEKQLAIVLKAALALTEEKEFDEFVAVLHDMQDQVEKSALFQEQGASAEAAEIAPDESAVARILKAQFAK